MYLKRYHLGANVLLKYYGINSININSIAYKCNAILFKCRRIITNYINTYLPVKISLWKIKLFEKSCRKYLAMQ